MTDEQNNPPLANPAPPAPVEKSRGDKLFDRALYAGLNGVGTFIITIPFAYRAKYGKGKEVLENIGEALGKTGMGRKYIDELTMMLATSLGGTAMVLPTWAAEHFRKPIVGWLNGKSSEPAGNAPVYEAPKQTIGSLLRGRILAMATVTASFRAAGAFFPKQFKNFEEAVGEKAVQLFAKGKTAEEILKTRRYGEMAAIDVFATAAATTILYTGSRFFASHRKHQPAIVATPLATAQETLARIEPPLQDAAPNEPSTTISGDKLQAGIVREHSKEAATQLA